MASKIEWTEETWNPVVGCTKCSPGCLNCYAERMAYRLACMGIPYYDEVNDGHWTNDVITLPASLDKPRHWRKPRKVFVCSMSDLFHEKVPFEFIWDIYRYMHMAKQHTYQILTKRIARAFEFYSHRSYLSTTEFNHVHLGVTVCTQKEADEKIPILLQIPAAVRFVSIEPMLESICLDKLFNTDVGFPDWIIVGAESGHKRRICEIHWVRYMLAQCRLWEIPIFVKQIHSDGKLVKMPKEFPQEYPNGQ